MPTTTTLKKGGEFRLHITFTQNNDKFYLPRGTKIDYLYLINTSNTPISLSSFDLINKSAVPNPESIFTGSLPPMSSIAHERFIELHPYLTRQLLSYSTTGQVEIEINAVFTQGGFNDILLIIGMSTIY